MAWQRHRQVFLILLVLALPYQLRIEGGIAGIENGLGLVLVGLDEAAQLARGNVGALIFVVHRLDRFGRNGVVLFASHRANS
jgi:hypothetical protein